MHKSFATYFCLGIVMSISITLSAQNSSSVQLKNKRIELEWNKEDNGYALQTLKVKKADGWSKMEPARYQHHVLYTSTHPESTPQKLYDEAGKEIIFPTPQYRYIIASWEQNTNAVALNTAGENIVYRPSGIKRVSDTEIHFRYENECLQITEKWSLDNTHPNDIKVTMILHPLKSGYYSLSTPSIASIDKYNFTWATVPGIFQGNTINHNFVNAYAYGQGIPDRPVVSKERTASTLSSIVTDKNGITIAVTAEPGTGRDPWPKDQKKHSEWELGLSVMNREGEFSPTLYHPVLGQKGSYANLGETLSFSFRYTIQDADWHTVLKHAINDIYRFPDLLKLKQTNRSLTQRLYEMHDYLTNDSTSKWNTYSYKGVTIGAQDYLGGVYESEKDAMKNSDYGAMWMLAKMTSDPRLAQKRLPYAVNFKLMQQHSEKDFFYGAAAGQYYLHKSQRFTEEWGPYTEPIATTYYMLMDMGNILLFEPQQKEVKQHLRIAADRLLEWMKANGQWEVAYNNQTNEVLFTDVKDLRPTFYGLLIAYRILKEDKYLHAAIKGANWYVENAVKKGHFLGVCGDTRFVPDFATAQSVQALLELYEITGDNQYKDAAISAAKIYTASVYTHPIPTNAIKQVKGVDRKDWEISQAGLSFEHGGVVGSANHRGPILLASHAGMFIRMYSLTKDSLFLNMARAAAIGRDAFVDPETGVASYYWDSMNNGAGPYPHHAWWQVGWITDYLLSEVELRSEGKITFPRGFITPKVGPHQTYGFTPGNIFGKKANLIMRPGLLVVDNPYIEYITAINEKEKIVYLLLMNNDDDKQQTRIIMDINHLLSGNKNQVKEVSQIDSSGNQTAMYSNETWQLDINAYGLTILKIRYK